MKRRAAIAAVLVLGLVLAATALHRLALGRVLGLAFSAATGRAVAVGRARLVPGVPLVLRLEHVVVGGPDAGSALAAAHIQRLEAALDPWSLVRGELRLAHLAVDGADVELQLGANGSSRDSAESAGVGRRVSLEHLDVKGLRGRLGELDFDLAGRYERGSAGAAEPGSIEIDATVAGASLSGRGWLAATDGELTGELPLTLRADHLALFSQALQRELPRLGPVRGSGRLELRDGRFGVSDIDLEVGNRDEAWFELKGRVGDLAGRRDFSLNADFGVADVRALSPLVGDPPHIGTITGKASLHDLTGKLRVEEFSLTGGRPGVFEIDADGRYEDVRGVHGLEARVDLQLRDLAVLGELLRRPLPPIGPVEFSGDVSGHRGEVVTRKLHVRLDRTRIEGSLSGSFQPGRRPQLKASLEVPELSLDDIGIVPRPAPGGAASARPPASVGVRKLFSAESFDLEALRVADGQLSIHTGGVAGEAGALFSQAKLEATLEGGALSVHGEATQAAEEADVTAELSLDARQSPPAVSLRGSARGIRLERVLGQFEQTHAYSGRFQGKLDLNTRGDSPQQLASHLDGELSFSCDGGTIAVAHAGLLTRDVFHVLRDAASRRDSEPLHCFIAEVAIRAGVAKVGPLVLDAGDVVIHGEGEVDLTAETLSGRLVPTPRHRSPLSTAATLEISGPLARPLVKVVRSSLLTSSTQAIFGSVTDLPGLRQVWQGLSGSGHSACDALFETSP